MKELNCSDDAVFQAVLAKNDITRALKNRELRWFDERYPKWIEFRLKEIEKVIGSCNQPTIDEIVQTRFDI